MNALLLMSSPRSHVIPTEPLIRELIDKGYSVYCMSTKNNKKMIELYGGHFLEYPNFIEPASCNNLDVNEIILNTNDFWKQGKIKEGYDYIIEKDIESVFDITNEQIDFICDVVKKYDIEVLFRDAVDKLGRLVAEKMNICCIGYMTHNMYSKKYFEKDANNLYAVFMNAKWRIKNLPINYFKDLRKKSEDLYEMFSKNRFPVFTHHQLDPMSDFTLIFSSEELQPKTSFYHNRDYLIIRPLKSRFNIEKDIDIKLQKFVNDYKTIIYISSGSFVTQSYHYYKNFIDVLSKNNVGIIVSAGKFNTPLKKYVKEKKIKNVYIEDFIPQKYVLSHANVFITSGGQNSIIESLYYKVPLFVTPMTSEQRINGLLIKELGIGETSYSLENDESISTMLNKLLRREIDNDKLDKMSKELLNKRNDFKPMWEYINGSKY